MIGQAFEVVGFEACHDVKQGVLPILFVVLLVYGKGLIEQVLRSIILGLKFCVDTKVVLAVRINMALLCLSLVEQALIHDFGLGVIA